MGPLVLLGCVPLTPLDGRAYMGPLVLPDGKEYMGHKVQTLCGLEIE